MHEAMHYHDRFSFKHCKYIRGENKGISRMDSPQLPYSAPTLLATPHFKKYPFSRFCPFSWKKYLFYRKKVSFVRKKMQLSMNKVLFSRKKEPICWKRVPNLLEKVPSCSKKRILFWLVHRCPNFLLPPPNYMFTSHQSLNR